MFTNACAKTSQICTKSQSRNSMCDFLETNTFPCRVSPKIHRHNKSCDIMLLVMVVLCICNFQGVCSMSIAETNSRKIADIGNHLEFNRTVAINAYETDSMRNALEVAAGNTEVSEKKGDEETQDESPSVVGGTQEFRDYNATLALRRSHAEAKAECSNMSSAELLKRHVEKLRNVDSGLVDLVFLVDMSSSVGKTDFFNELRFVRKLLAGFEVAEWATRAAVVTFSSLHRVLVNIDHLSRPSANKHKCSLLNSELPEITYIGGGTYTRGAFIAAMNILSSQHARPNATKAVFLITDGYSNGGDPLPILENSVWHNVEIFTFGIQNGNVKELHAMASEPKREHCYILDSFVEFEALARRALHEDLPLGDFIMENTAQCSSLCPASGQCCDPAATCRCGTTTGQYECICPAGYHGSGLLGGCHACPVGTYKPQAVPGGISTCKTCPDPNHTSIPGSMTIADCTCRSGFQPVVGVPACELIKCPILSPPENGFFYKGECSNTALGACAVFCSPGYELVGRSIIACTEFGSWSAEPAVCQVKKCHPLQPVRSGMIHCTKEDFTFATQCTTLCSEGHILIGSKTRRCLPIAVWGGLPSACRAVTCPPLEPVPHSTLQPDTCSSDRQLYGTECTTVCSPGYQIKDEDGGARSCLASGLWSSKSDQLNVCIDVTTPDILCPTDITIDSIPNENFANVSWPEPLTIDNSGETPTVTVTPAVSSPWFFPIGDNFITYFATDRAGNTGSCSFVIHVIDSQPPVIEKCRSPGVIVTGPDNQEANVEWEEPEFSDNSDRPVTVSRSHGPGLSFSFGTTNVEYIARDATGNTKRCHITVSVQQNACLIPDHPKHGQANCVSVNGGIECSLQCDDGYGFPIEPETMYRCSEGGQWSPANALPWGDCTRKESPMHAELPVKFTFPVDYCDQSLADEMADNIWRTQADKGVTICSGPVDCKLAGVKVNCQPKGPNSPLSVTDFATSRSQHQQLREDIGFSQEQFEKLRRQPSVFVDMNITGELKLPEGVTSVNADSYHALRSSLSSMSDSIVQSIIEEEAIPSGMGTLADPNSVVLLPTEVMPVCSQGNVVGFGLCLQCSAGSFFNVETNNCERCHQGTYQDLPGQLECIVCPTGTSTAITRAQSLQDCKALCNPGSHSNTGLEQCETCPRGSYQPHLGSTDCVLCPDGTSTAKTGSISASDCAEPCKSGYVSRSGLVPCLPCLDGYYQPGINKTSCFKCPQTTAINTSVATWEDCIGSDLKGFNISMLEVLPYNDCFSFPCGRWGSCEPVSMGYVCECMPGYSGTLCDVEINECDSAPCLNGASCQNQLNDFICICPEGFQGKTCNLNIDECEFSSCLNNGTCIDGIGSYRCVCAKGFTGQLCELDVDECLSQPCYHDADCINGQASFSCDCRPGYYGTLCEMQTDECLSRPCLNGATCQDLVAGYRCDCASGFSGIHCEVNIDECLSSPCQHNSMCQDDLASFQCLCQPGYTGQMCEVELAWNFNLGFEHASTTSYVLKKPVLPDLREVTVAFWMRTEDDDHYGSPFSYSAVNSNGTKFANALTFLDYTGFALYIANSRRISDVTANDGFWHHMAVTWSSRNGGWAIYKDGHLADSGEGLARGAVIPGGGVFVLGQEQDSVGGDFASSESFIGELTLLNVWDRALDGTTIRNLVQDCQKKPEIDGVVLAWSDFPSGIYGEIRHLPNNFCQGCDAPFRPAYGQYSGYQSGTPLNVVSYSCKSGFEFDDTYQEAVCQVSGDWLPYEPPVCKRKQCLYPGNIAHGEIIGTTFPYQSQIKYVCYHGYSLIGPAYRECLETGAWSAYQPRCATIQCEEVPIIPNSYIYSFQAGAPASTETLLTYRCLDGYRLVGPDTVTCSSDGRTNQLPACIATICKEPDKKLHSFYSSSEGYILGERVTYKCNAGYRLVGNGTRTCRSNGLWSGTSPRCVPLQCGPPPNITLATHNTMETKVGSIAWYSCLEGYSMHGNGSLQCISYNRWAGELFECLPTPCSDIRPLPNGTVVGDQFYYGRSVMFSCALGHRLQGPAFLTCLANGVWNGSTPVCEPVSCGSPDVIQNGLITGEDYKFGGVITYHCNVGFNVIGQFTRSCDVDGQWNGTAPHCDRVTCGLPPQILNADIVSWDQDVYFYQDQVMFECNIGYRLVKGRGHLMCGLDGIWQGEMEMCEVVTCERLGGLLNGKLIRTGRTFNDSARYICHEGFTLVGILIRICQANGSWSGTASRCHRISCPDLPKVSHARFVAKTPNDSSSYLYKTKIRYWCDSGYQLYGNQELRCTVNGQWSSIPPVCRPIRCHDLTIPSHGTILGSDFTYKKSVTYTCDAGYQLIGKAIRTCLADGTWTGNFPVCKIVVCREPAKPENGQIVGHNFLYQSVVNYSCDKGHTLNGATNTTCLATGDWSSTPPRCEPIDCGLPPAVTNTTLGINSTLYGSLAEYSCLEGYSADTGLTAQCMSDGVWMGVTNISCIPMQCGDPPVLEYAFVEDFDYYVGDVAEYRCIEGAVLQGNGHVTCQPNRTWSAPLGFCHLIVCPELIAPNHGAVFAIHRRNGSIATYSCDEGYFVVGEINATCLETSTWSEVPPECEPVLCPVLFIENGTAIFSNRTFLNDVSYMCDTGYQMIGIHKQHCLANGTWSGRVPVCKLISCGIPHLISNGHVEQIEVFYREEVAYACYAGYQLQGEATRTCGSNGELTGEEPLCKIITCPELPRIENAVHSDVNLTYGSLVSYYCIEGYYANQHSYILECLVNGSWSQTVMKCLPVFCGHPDSIENGNYSSDGDFTFSSVVVYICNEGYTLQGSPSVSCQSNGNWTTANVHCEPVSCGPPPQVEDGDVEWDLQTFHSSAMYTCHMGYRIVGPDQKICQSNGSWSYSDVRCMPVSCDQPKPINNGRWLAEGFIFKNRITYACDMGHEMVGVSIQECKATGQWSEEPPACKPVKCALPSIVTNGMITIEGDLHYKSKIKHRCHAGYIPSTPNLTQTCQADGSWSGQRPICFPISCGSPPLIDNTHVPVTHTLVFNTTIEYQCHIGYQLQGIPAMSCLANGSWSIPQFQCHPISCGNLNDISHGKVQVSSFMLNSRAMYICDKGYRIHGASVRRCQANRFWSSTTPVCKPVQCGLPPIILNAVHVRDISLAIKEYVLGTVAHYTCIEGYKMTSSDTLVCQANGTWNSTSLSCWIKHCPQPSLIQNGHILGEVFIYRSTLEYVCDPGYQIIGSANQMCLGNETWHPSLPPKCTLVSCPKIVAPPHTEVFGEGHNYQDVLTFRCSNNLELRGARELHCTANGTWDNSPPSCGPRSCGRPADLINGDIFGHSYQPGDTVSYHCHVGFQLKGPSARRCLPDYRWSGQDPICIKPDPSSALNQSPVCIFPCLHGGTCVAPYQCRCPYGYTGSRCEIELCTNRCIGTAHCVERHPACKQR